MCVIEKNEMGGYLYMCVCVCVIEKNEMGGYLYVCVCLCVCVFV